MKIRLKFTMQDYYDYVGTNHIIKDGLVSRVRFSIPNEFREGYNLKFKKLDPKQKSYYYWKTLYRVSITVDTTEEKIQEFLEKRKSYCYQLENFSYKIVKRRI